LLIYGEGLYTAIPEASELSVFSPLLPMRAQMGNLIALKNVHDFTGCKRGFVEVKAPWADKSGATGIRRPR